MTNSNFGCRELAELTLTGLALTRRAVERGELSLKRPLVPYRRDLGYSKLPVTIIQINCQLLSLLLLKSINLMDTVAKLQGKHITVLAESANTGPLLFTQHY